MAARLPHWTLRGSSSAVKRNRQLDVFLVRTSICPRFMLILSSKISISASSLQLSQSTAIRPSRDISSKLLHLLQAWAPTPKSNKPCYSKLSNKQPRLVIITNSGCPIQEIKCMHHLHQTRPPWALINSEKIKTVLGNQGGPLYKISANRPSFMTESKIVKMSEEVRQLIVPHLLLLVQ